MISVALKWLFFNYLSTVGLDHSVGILDIFPLSSGIWVIFLMLDLILSFSYDLCFSVSVWMAFDLRKENIYWVIKWLTLEIKKVFIVFSW